jgi:hypothetical protein
MDPSPREPDVFSVLPIRIGINRSSTYYRVAEKRKPARTSPRIRFRPVRNTRQTANHVLVDLDAESQRDLLSAAGTAPVGITRFHGNGGVDEGFVRSLGAGPPPTLGRKQHAVVSLPQHTVQMQQSGRLPNDGGTENASRAHVKGTQAGLGPIGARRLGARLRARLRTSADSATTERSPPGFAGRATVTII